MQVIGTIITEWDAGAETCSEMLASEEAAEAAAEKLALVAAHFGFDGWLVNIENKVETEKIPHLLHFVR